VLYFPAHRYRLLGPLPASFAGYPPENCPLAPRKQDQPDELMIVNDAPGEECRIAITENGHLEELFTERAANATNVGNIYKGRVTNVEPAIQAAFIDYGKGVNGFLHISDLHPRYFPGAERTERVGKKIPRRDRPLIQESLKRGDEVLVQVLKEGIGTKGPTLTSYLSIPGRLLVAMPEMDRVGVSRKVEDEEKRRKMRQILDSLDLPEGFGFILRTAGFDRTKVELKRDVAYLMRLWKTMDRRMKASKGPCELYTESDLLVRTIRDVLRPSIKAIIVDSESAYNRAKNFLGIAAPRSAPKVIRYRRSSPIFHAFDIERQIDLIHSREVPLPSGGQLVIEQTEALVAIDVNSGRSRSARDSETNAYNTNCEAVDEICRQLRLRDLGGLIINDLIDMRSRKNRRAIEERFQNNLKRDRARTTMLRISDFGLVELTRQRMRPSLRKSHFIPCTHCNGHGEIRSPESVGADAVRQIGYLFQFERVKRVELVCSPRVASVLLSGKRRELVRLEDASGKRVDVRVSDAIALDRVDFYAYDDRNADIDVTQLVPPQTPTLKELEAEAREAAKQESAKRDAAATPPIRKESELERKPASRRKRGRKATKAAEAAEPAGATEPVAESDEQPEGVSDDGSPTTKKRRRSRRGGRRHRKRAREAQATADPTAPQSSPTSSEVVTPDNKDARPTVRIHELAKELRVPSRAVLDKCEQASEITVKNHMSSVPVDIADQIREWFVAETDSDETPRGPSRNADKAAVQESPDGTHAGKRSSRRRSKKKSAQQSAKSAEPTAATASNEDAHDGAPSQQAQSKPKLDRSRRKRGGKKRSKEAARKSEKTRKGSDAQAGSDRSENGSPSAPPSQDAEVSENRPKPRRRLYRNRSRVSPTAREEAERVID
jgi:ribonuclease E